MTPAECLRFLQRLHFSPRAGRPVSISWLSRQANYQPRSVMHAIARGHITHLMAKRLSPVLARLVLEQGGYIAPTLGPLGGGSAGLGRPGPPPRRPEAKITRSSLGGGTARMQRDGGRRRTNVDK